MRNAFLLLVIAASIAACRNPSSPEKVKEYSIEQLFNNKMVSGNAFNADESKLLITSSATGIFNAYELTVADTSLMPLTRSTKESCFGVDYFGHSGKFLYSSDSGGNENSHLYLSDRSVTAPRDLTPWPHSSNALAGWGTDSSYFYVLSNKRNPKFFDAYKMDTAGFTPTILYANDSGYSSMLISKTEKYIALTKSITTDKNDLYLLNRQTGQLRRISNDHEANWQPQAFERNDSIFYYTSSDGSEFSYLVRYNINTGKAEKAFETKWDVVYMQLGEHEKYHLVGVNNDGKQDLLLFDHATNKKIDFPAMEDGSIVSAFLSPSEKNIALTVGSSRSPNDLYVYNFESRKLKQVTRSLNKDITPNDLVSAEVVRFPSFDGKEIPAILYKPHNASKDQKVPGLLWIHGGPGGQSVIWFSNQIQFLVNHGYAVLAVNNRGSSGYGKTFYKLDNKDHSNGDLKDCVWGKKWLQQQDYIDSSRIGIEGGSYGGCMVLTALAFYPEEFRAGVDLYGVTNWVRTLRSIPPYWEADRKALYDEMGDPYTSDSVMLKKTSPLFNYEKINKPLIVFQGMNDVRVLPVESKEIVEGVQKNGVPVQYITYANEGHGFQKKENQVRTAKETLTFLDKYLKGDGYKPAKTLTNKTD